MDNFTPFASLAGGALIGLSASLMLWWHGKIAGVSGIYGPLLKPRAGDIGWRLAFVAGLVVPGLLVSLVAGGWVAPPSDRPLAAVAVAGLLVGFGVRMGNGCTSGHGVCGLTRLSRRSAVAVATFMTTGALVASIAPLLLGGV